MYIDDFLSKIQKEPLPTAVMFTGDAEDIKAEGLSRLKAAFRKKHSNGQIRFYDGTSSDLVDALGEAVTPSLFAEPKLMVFLNVKKAQVSEAPGLGDFLLSPVDHHHLVFLVTGGKKTAKAAGDETKNGAARKDSNTASAMKKFAWTVECSPLADWKAADWVIRAAIEQGLQIKKDVALELLEQTGLDVTCVRQALELLKSELSPRTQVSSRDLTVNPLPGSEPEIFELMDALGQRKAPKALSLLGRFEGEERGAVSVLASRTRELFQIALLKAEGKGQEFVVKELGVSPFRLRNLWSQAGNYTLDELRGMLRELIELQAATVTGRLGKNSQTGALETWILKRLGPAQKYHAK